MLFEAIYSDIIFNFLKDINIFYKFFDKKYIFGFNFELFECMNESVVFNMVF